jgi:hypothetical protein
VQGEHFYPPIAAHQEYVAVVVGALTSLNNEFFELLTESARAVEFGSGRSSFSFQAF